MPRWSTTSISASGESIWHSELAGFPALIATDDKGNDLFLGTAR